MATRRRFIQAGLAGVALLATARWLQPAPAAPASTLRFLDDEGAAIVAALVPVVLAGALPAQREARADAVRGAVAAFDRTVSGLTPAIREEIADLFGVLRFAPTRFVLTGLWTPLDRALPAELGAFLASWRASRFGLLQSGYRALTQIIQAGWYDTPEAWAAIGYPGPPPLAPLR